MLTFTVVITHEIITFQAICMDKIPKDFTSIKDTNYAPLIPFYFCSLSTLKKKDSDIQKKLDDKDADLHSVKSELKIIKDSIADKTRLMQGTCICRKIMVIIFSNDIFNTTCFPFME